MQLWTLTCRGSLRGVLRILETPSGLISIMLMHMHIFVSLCELLECSTTGKRMELEGTGNLSDKILEPPLTLDRCRLSHISYQRDIMHRYGYKIIGQVISVILKTVSTKIQGLFSAKYSSNQLAKRSTHVKHAPAGALHCMVYPYSTGLGSLLSLLVGTLLKRGASVTPQR